MKLRARILAQQQQRQQAQLWRRARAWQQQAGQILCGADDQILVNFAGNDYLGLAQHPAVKDAMAKAALRFGAGSGASRLVSGSHPEHIALEQAIARWLGREDALFFASGFQLNSCLLSAFLKRGDRVVCDRLNHASLVDSARLCEAVVRRYRHVDVDSAQQQLADATHDDSDAAVVIATDGVFSMDGDVAPVRSLQAMAQHHGALLVVDDAHGLGVLGDSGLGVFEHQRIPVAADTLLIGTCGKALGTSGAFVAGDGVWIEQLRQHARGWIYSTAPPPALAVATRTALDIIQQEPQRRMALHDNISWFRRLLAAQHLPDSGSTSAIQPVIVGENEKALALSHALEQQGFWVVAMREPTVPRGTARLRITLAADHEPAYIEALVQALAEAWQQLGLAADGASDSSSSSLETS
jgi:8-amino-7-oxononanoate synthase